MQVKYVLTEEEQKSILDIIKDHSFGEGVRKMLKQYHVPETIIKRATGAMYGADIGISSYLYYEQLVEMGYPKTIGTQLCAVEGAAVKFVVSYVGWAVVCEGGELIVASPEAAAVGGPLGFGVVIVGGIAVVIGGGTVLLNANSLGLNAAVSQCDLINNAYTVTAPPLNVGGYHFENGTVHHVDHFSSDAEIEQFKDFVKNDPTLTLHQKAEILDNFDRQIESQSMLHMLGIDYTKVTPQGLALLSYPNEVLNSELHPEKLITSKEEDEDIIYDYDWSALGIELPAGDQSRKQMRKHVAGNGGPLTADGKLVNPSSIVNNGKPFSEQPASQIPLNPNNALPFIQQTCQLSPKESAMLKEILKNTTITLADGKQVGINVAIAWLVDNELQRKKAENQAARSKQEIQGYLDAASAIASIGHFIGNQKLEKFGYAAGHLCNMGLAIVRINSGDVVGGVASFVMSTLGLVGLFRKKEMVDPNQLILQGLHSISQQLEELRAQITQGFIHIDLKLDFILKQMLEGFQTAYVEIYLSRMITNRKLNEIQLSIHQLSIQLDKQISGLWLNSLIDACFTIKNFQRRKGNLDSFPPNQFIATADTLVGWFSEKSSHENSTGAHLFYMNCPFDKVLAVLKSADINDIVGFLIAYARYQLGITINTADENVRNANIWLLAAKAYQELISEVKEEFIANYDPKYAQFKELLNAGTQLLQFYQNLQTNISLFDSLLHNYFNSLTQISNSFSPLLSLMGSAERAQHLSNKKAAEEAKISRRRSKFNSHCATNVTVTKKHENKEVYGTINHWNQVIAAEIVPHFFAEYETTLLQDLEQTDSQKPLTAFYEESEFQSYLLPLSVLFKTDSSLKEALTKLFMAEKFNLGYLNISVDNFAENLLTEGADRTDRRFPLLKAADIKVTISFHFNNRQPAVDIAKVKLATPVARYHAAVSQIRDYVAINSKYMAEIGHDYYNNAYKTLRHVIFLSAWLKSEIKEVNLLYQPNNALDAQVDAILNQFVTVNMAKLRLQLIEGTADITGSTEYGLAFEKFQSDLNDHEVTYQLLISYATLAGFPTQTLNMMKSLWDKEYLVELMRHLANLPAPAPNQRGPQVAQVEKINSFEKAIDVHLKKFDDHTEKSLHGQLPTSSSYLEVLDAVHQVVAYAKDHPYFYTNPVQAIILNNLRLIVEETKLQKMHINLTPEYLTNFTWYKKYLYDPNAPHKTQSEAYTLDDIEKLLVYDFEVDQEGPQAKVVPGHYPDLNLPVFRESFSKILKQAFNFCITERKPLLIPLCFEQNPDSDEPKQLRWVLLAAKPKAITGSIEVSYVDPLGNELANEQLLELDIALEYEHANAIRKELINQICKALQQPGLSARLLISGVKQIELTDWQQSGPLLIKNAQDFLNGIDISHDMLEHIAEIRAEQNVMLKEIWANHPDLFAQPLNITQTGPVPIPLPAPAIPALPANILAQITNAPPGCQLVYTANQYSYLLAEENGIVLIPSHGTGNGTIANFEGQVFAFNRIAFGPQHNQVATIPQGYKVAFVESNRPQEIQLVNTPLTTDVSGSTRYLNGHNWVTVNVHCVNGKTNSFPRCVFAEPVGPQALPQDAFGIPNGYHIVAIRVNDGLVPVLKQVNEGAPCKEAGHNPTGHPPAGIADARGLTQQFKRLLLTTRPVPPAPLPAPIAPAAQANVNVPPPARARRAPGAVAPHAAIFGQANVNVNPAPPPPGVAFKHN